MNALFKYVGQRWFEIFVNNNGQTCVTYLFAEKCCIWPVNNTLLKGVKFNLWRRLNFLLALKVFTCFMRWEFALPKRFWDWEMYMKIGTGVCVKTHKIQIVGTETVCF